MKRIPNLILGIGAQKAGTTWLHANLSKHPEINCGFIKEMHYFDYVHKGYQILNRKRSERLIDLCRNRPEVVERFFIGETPEQRELNAYKILEACQGDVGDSWYVGLMTDREKKWSLDITPEYGLLDEGGFRHVQRLANEVKVLLILRDPVERAFSGLVHEFKKDMAVVAALGDDETRKRLGSWGNVARTNYVRMLRNARSVFGERNVNVLFYDDIKSDPVGLLRNVVDFIGIEFDERVVAASDERVHQSPRYEFSDELEHYVFDLHAGMVRELSSLVELPHAWRRYL